MICTHGKNRDLVFATAITIPGSIRKDVYVKSLRKIVQRRKVTLLKENFEEKLTADCLPFEVLQKLPDIEYQFWQRNSFHKIYYVSSLRDRMFLLFSHAGMLRGESLRNAELSDLFHITKDDEGPPGHPATILILQILDGKQNKDGKPVWGRCMRNNDPTECPLGGTGLYLMGRL